MRTWYILSARSLVFVAAVALGGTSAFASGAAVSEDQLESFLGLAGGTLLDVGNGPIGNGSAIQTTFTATAGQVLSFQYRFLTNEDPTDLANVVNDFAFVTLNSGEPMSIADVVSTTLSAASPPFALGSALLTFSTTLSTAGVYSLGVGVVNVTDDTYPSGLLVSNLQLGSTSLPIGGFTAAGNTQAMGTPAILLSASVPEPMSVISLGVGGLAVLAILSGRGRRNVA